MKGDDQGQVEHSKVFRNSKMCKKIPKCNEASNIFLEFTKYKTRGQFFYFQDTVIVRKLHFSKEIDLLFKK